MTSKNEREACCADELACGCRVEAILSIDERGQMVLPKDVRERAGIRPGDKLALLSLEKDGHVCCLTLIRSEEIESLVRTRFGPVMNEAFRE